MYSTNNVTLIHAQRPDATCVAGYRARQALGRQVRKREQGIRIVVSYLTRFEPVEEGQPVEVVYGFGVSTVFGVAQTEGEPLPPPIHGTLTGDVTVADVVREERVQWLRGQGVTLACKDTDRANGYYLPPIREIAVHRDLTGLRTRKTLVHAEAKWAADHYSGVRREDAETVAEGAAYAVLAHFGLAMSGYRFGYAAHCGRATRRWCGATSR
jgi:antirestriction protein ArdC